MSCDICGRGSCATWFHSIAEQERFEKVIEAFDKAREMRDEVRSAIAEEGPPEDDSPEDEEES